MRFQEIEQQTEQIYIFREDRDYECLERLDAHRTALFTNSQACWKDLFGGSYDLLLHDLTSAYFEGQMEQAR